MLVATKKLKIWTIISHGFILIGAGHGSQFLFMIEFFFFPYITEQNFSFSFGIAVNHFSVIGLLTLLGQTALFLSIVNKIPKLKNALQIAGLCLLWLGVVYCVYDVTQDSYMYIALITVVPFLICTIITFIGYYLKRFYRWIVDA